MTTVHTLVPAHVLAVREWASRNRHIVSDHNPGYPYLTASKSDGTLYLHSGGRVVAGALEAHAMTALLYNECLEPGFTLRLHDPAFTCEEALWTPHKRLQARQSAAAAAHAQRTKADLLDAAATRRSSHLTHDPELSKLTFDDLFGTL